MDMLLFFKEKTEFPFLVFPYFPVMPSISVHTAGKQHRRVCVQTCSPVLCVLGVRIHVQVQDFGHGAHIYKLVTSTLTAYLACMQP